MTENDITGLNWEGSVPVVVSLASTSLSSPTIPPEHHILVSRHTFLHLGLEKAVRRLYSYAPRSTLQGQRLEEPDSDEEIVKDPDTTTTTSKDPATENYPVCWFEDMESVTPLRWHLFVGVLYDLNGKNALPWKIRVHFNRYPTSQLLPLEHGQVLPSIRFTYKHSLKQAMTLIHGNAKVALNMSKQAHEQLWEAILYTDSRLHSSVMSENKSDQTNVAVRLLVDGRPPRSTKVDGKMTLADFVTNIHEGPVKRIRIGGIEPDREASTLEELTSLVHPDRFLYIIVTTKE